MLQNGDKLEYHTIELKKSIGAYWTLMVFGGAPAFDEKILFYGEPEGTLFQLDDNGQRTGQTGVSENCFNYEVYVSAAIESVKPAGTSALNIYKNLATSPLNPGKISAYINGEALFEDSLR